LLVLLLPALALKAGWREVDTNGDGTPEHVAVTNLMDVAFNDEGKIVGWYVKPVKGREIKDYARAANLIRPDLERPGLAGEALRAEAFEDQGDALVARFRGEGVAVVWTIPKERYTTELSVESDRPQKLIWSGIGGSDRPTTKILLKGDDKPLPAGEGEAVYVAIQSRPNRGYAFVLVPPEPLFAKLEPQGAGALATFSLPAGTTTLRVYGGQNELVRYHVEGLLSLPGLFKPNIWGQLSLGLIALMEFFYRLTGNWGLAILLLTLVVRLLLWPLMHQQFKAMAEMQRLKPYVDEINKKYKDDPEKKNQELMKLYAEHKVNPAAGCLPMFIQLPLLFVLWRVIANYEFGEGFLWIPDLSLPDPYYLLPLFYVLRDDRPDPAYVPGQQGPDPPKPVHELNLPLPGAAVPGRGDALLGLLHPDRPLPAVVDQSATEIAAGQGIIEPWRAKSATWKISSPASASRKTARSPTNRRLRRPRAKPKKPPPKPRKR